MIHAVFVAVLDRVDELEKSVPDEGRVVDVEPAPDYRVLHAAPPRIKHHEHVFVLLPACKNPVKLYDAWQTRD